MRIISVGEEINHQLVTVEQFSSPVSFLDYDFLVWNPAHLFYEYKAEYPSSTFQGHRSLNDDASAKIVEDVARRKGEILELVDLGRTVVVFLPPPDKCYYATGEKAYSGTGRSRVATRIVNGLDLLSTIPVKNLSATVAEGENVEFRGNGPFKTYWSKVKGLHYYSAYLTNPVGKPFLFIKGTSRVIGTWIPTQRGVFLILPQFCGQRNHNTKKDFLSACGIFIDALVELSSNLKKETGDFQLPEWTKRILLPGEELQRQEIQKREGEISKALSEVSQLKEQLANTERYKLLLSGTGRALEVQVATILREVGFEVNEPADGRDDLILKFNDRVAVAEIKGVTKSAAEKHAAQLEKWVSEYLTTNDIKSKGMLIVNAFNDTPLDARTESAFPNQMIKYCTNREHCLITTTQLLYLALYLRENPDQRDGVINELLSTNGVYPKFLDQKPWLTTESAVQETLESKKD
jgi:hypothetical protein